MKESYPDDIMLCFIQGFGNGKIRDYDREEVTDSSKQPRKKHKKLMLHIEQPNGFDPVPEVSGDNPDAFTYSSDVVNRSRKSFAGKSLRLATGDRFLNRLPEVKRSFSDRFTVIADTSGKRSSKGLETIRKTWSTGNFASGAAGGGCGAPRSAPATPLQLEPHPRKHDKHAVKPLSGSAPSVRADTADEAADGKQPSKSRQKKFQRHFPQVGPEERVLNYYSCALVGDLLLQGHLYITKNYFAFYSNVFGYVTKLLIPVTSVLRITKEKVARIIPNAVGVCTRDERHVFGSLLSRDSTYKLMTHVWKASRAPETAVPKPQVSEVELDASEYSPEDESSSGGAEPVPAPVAAPVKRESDAMMPAGVSAVIQPALLTGAPAPGVKRGGPWRALLLLAVVLLAATAALLGYRLVASSGEMSQNEFASLSGDEMYSEVVRWRARLHGRAAAELHAFLTTNLLLLTKVRQSLEALSGVILTDMAHNHGPIVDVPNETAFS